MSGKGSAKSFNSYFLAVPRDEYESILAEGFTCRRRSYVPVSATPSEALFGFARSARRAGARCARPAVVIQVRGVPASVKCLEEDEGFRLLTTHLPANLLSKAHVGHTGEAFDRQMVDNTKCIDAAGKNCAVVVGETGAIACEELDLTQELLALKTKNSEMESTMTRMTEIVSAKASAEALALAKAEQTRQSHEQEVGVLRRRLDEMALAKESLKGVVDLFSNVARPQYWTLKTRNALPSFELIDVTTPLLTSWIGSWMWASSHDECKIGKPLPRITRVRRVESDAHWLRFQTQIVSMRAYHKQHDIELKPVEPYVWYPPAEHAPRALLHSLQNSMNEHLLFHGTSPETAENIVKQGFDIVRTRDGSMYGAGFYFAQEFCKSAQYGRGSKGSSTKGTLLICRVALGDVKYHTSGSFTDTQRPKRSDGTVYDALIVEPRPKPPLQVHREFVVHESSQIYVEYVVDYDLDRLE